MAETTTLTLVDFLLARIAEDEKATWPALSGPWRPDASKRQAALTALDGWRFLRRSDGMGTLRHIARWDPDRVLAECEAKRRIVKLHAATHYCIPHSGHADTGVWYEEGSAYAYPCPTLALLALPYVDHPDYDEEWRP